MTPPAPEKSMVTGDPTERLLTSLSRFKRQVSRAEEGVPQDAWCDECINQLIVGIEIALNEGWTDVKEALTDTARILQTYEEASVATDCVPFLNDSYEILCLLVGDLLLDNVRSGVMTKWRARYEQALEELQSQGLTLVDDNGADDLDPQHETAVDAENQTFDTPVPFGTPANEDGGRAFDEGDAFDALLGDDAPAEGLAYAKSPLEVADDPFAPVDDDESPFQTPPLSQDSDESTLSTDAEPFDGTLEEDDSDLSLSNDFTAEDSEVDATPSETAPQDEADALFGEGESLFEGPSEATEPEALESVQEDVEEATEAMPPEPAEEEPAPAPVMEEVAITPPVAPAVEPEPGSPEALWKTAQEAMSLGNVADAKNFALQLAANMARLEADQVEARTTEIEARIQANLDEIEAAEQAVTDAENRVKELEAQSAQCQQDFENKRQHVQQLRDDVAAAEGRVSDLDEQIAALEAQRDEERKGLAEQQSHLDDSLSEESRMQAELGDLSEEEGGARENLESVRERVSALQGSGTSHEEELQAAREELERRRASVLDIERTLGQIGGTPDGESTPEENGDDDAVSDESHEHGA